MEKRKKSFSLSGAGDAPPSTHTHTHQSENALKMGLCTRDCGKTLMSSVNTMETLP